MLNQQFQMERTCVAMNDYFYDKKVLKKLTHVVFVLRL